MMGPMQTPQFHNSHTSHKSFFWFFTMSYATPADFLQRYDARLIGDLVSDTGTPVSAGGLPTNAVLQAVLDDASAAVDAAVFVGDRYTPAQMASLSTTAASFVRRLVCDLALLYLKRRRGRFDAEKDSALLKELNETLKSLREGEDYLMLGTQTEAAAATIELVQPHLVAVPALRTIRNRTRNYYPLPPDGFDPQGDCLH